MLSDRLIEYLQKTWDGPSIHVRIKHRAFTLGGESAKCPDPSSSPPPPTQVIVHRPQALRGLLIRPSLAFGEAYMNGDIEIRGDVKDVLRGCGSGTVLEHGPIARGVNLLAGLPRPTSRRRAIANARHHYDVGNTFYQLWLDPTMTYSCAYFLNDENTIAQAQRQKLELLCRKTRLQPGQTLLDIGCGWGGLLFHAARRFGVKATGITPSRQQADHIEAKAREEGMDDRVRVIRGEWRQLKGQYDRIISVGMFEHVGLAQYPAFFRKWSELLKPGGLSLLHSIGRMKPEAPDPWIRKYIFPGGYLPALGQIVRLAARANLSVMDVENLWQHYARTLACWSANYQAVRDQVVGMFDERFAKMWWLYLQGAEAGFRWGGLNLWQVVLAGDRPNPWPLNRDSRIEEAELASSIA